MRLTEYIEREGLTLETFGERIGVTKGRLSQLNKDGVNWPPELALTAEEKTGGELNAAELSPIIARAREERAA